MSNRDEPEQASFFVSRRGRQVGLSQVDLKGIDIDNEQNLSKTTQNAPSSRHPQKVSPGVKVKSADVTVRREWSRRKKLTLLVVVVLLLAFPLVAGEFVAAQYRAGITGAKDDMKQIVAKTVLPAQKKTSITADQLGTMATDVTGIVGHMCRGGLVDNAASLYPRANSALTDCKHSQSQYAALASSLYELEKQTRYLEHVSAVIKPITTPITDAYAVVGAQQSSWLAAKEGLKKLSPPTKMNSAHADLASHVAAASEAWSTLNSANNSHDATAFTEAEKQLATEYEAVRSTSSAFTNVLKDTQSEITTEYAIIK